MTNDARFEIRLPAEMRREIYALAAEIGLSAADVVRLKIRNEFDIWKLLGANATGTAA
jgi:hypothetical protein